MVESAPKPPHARGHDLRLQPVHHDQLDHRQVNLDRGPVIRTLPAQHPRQPQPIMTLSPKVADHRWPVVVRRRENYPEILE